MTDIKPVLERLEALKDYTTRLRPYQSLSLEAYLEDDAAQWIVERGLQLAIQAVLDIGAHILAADFGKRPQEYREIIRQMGSVGVLPRDFAKRIAGMSGFRNILVHSYLEIDPHQVYEALQSLDDFEVFANHVLEYLKRTGTLEA